MSGLKKFFPYSSNLLQQSSEVALSTLAGKTVLLYFSASWCPPCRGFTPKLIEFYKAHQEQKNFEIVLVPWDEDENEFKSYYAKMPWLSLPFSDKKGRELLSEGFQVQTIPTLVGVTADDGKIITLNARNMVVKDPEAKEFPWPEKESSKL